MLKVSVEANVIGPSMLKDEARGIFFSVSVLEAVMVPGETSVLNDAEAVT